MKKKYWNVQIEFYRDGSVSAAVMRNQTAIKQPRDAYKPDPGREVYSLWYKSELSAQKDVNKALSMNKKKEAAA